MRRLVAVLSIVVVGAIAAGSATAASTARPRVTFFGDSVAAALAYERKARTLLSKGLDLRIDAKVCRRLAETGARTAATAPRASCPLVEKPSESLGDVVVIDVGYNDDPGDYGRDIDRVMQALVRQGVTTVIWVTMQERRLLYRATNASIQSASKRWPQIRIADWDDASRARGSWFVDDGLHLSSAGALGLARFLRPLVVAWSCTPSCQRERRIVDTAA